MPSNAVDKPRPTRESLLRELEEIKASLMDEDTIEPVAVFEEEAHQQSYTHSAQTTVEDEDIVLIDQELEKPEHALPGQQSLFDEHAPVKHQDKNVHQPLRSDKKGENPFLPSHIRARLLQNKTSMMEELADVGRTLARHDKTLHPEDAYAELVDQLVDQYLPEIEKQLRNKLRERLHSDLDDKK